MAKSRVKISDFTNRDKTNMLELFVNNEKTLLKIYEILFPHRAGPNAGSGVSSSMVADAGNVYGQGALRVLTRGSGRSQGAIKGLSDTANSFMNNSYHQRMTHDNNALLNRIAPNGVSADYNAEIMRAGGFYPN